MRNFLVLVLLTLTFGGCATTAPGPDSASQRNLAAAKKFYADFLRGDIDSVVNAMSDDITWVMPGPASLPYSGVRHGKTEWKGYLQGLSGATEIVGFEPKEFLAAEDRVVVLGNEQLKVKATGKTIDGEWAQVLTFKDGKLVKFQSFDDTAAAVEAFTPAR